MLCLSPSRSTAPGWVSLARRARILGFPYASPFLPVVASGFGLLAELLLLLLGRCRGAEGVPFIELLSDTAADPVPSLFLEVSGPTQVQTLSFGCVSGVGNKILELILPLLGPEVLGDPLAFLWW